MIDPEAGRETSPDRYHEAADRLDSPCEHAMPLKVIGAGLGRTGTLSLKVALEELGFARCYHMTEVLARPGHVQVWDAAAWGEPVDWEAPVPRIPGDASIGPAATSTGSFSGSTPRRR